MDQKLIEQFTESVAAMVKQQAALTELLERAQGDISDLKRGIAKIEAAGKETPIVWAVNVGDLKSILSAPQGAFDANFLEFIKKGLPKVININATDATAAAAEKGKIIDLYKKG